MAYKLTLEIGEQEDGLWYSISDEHDEPYAGGSADTLKDILYNAEPYLREILDESFPVNEYPTIEEYEAELARVKAENVQKYAGRQWT